MLSRSLPTANTLRYVDGRESGLVFAVSLDGSFRRCSCRDGSVVVCHCQFQTAMDVVRYGVEGVCTQRERGEYIVDRSSGRDRALFFFRRRRERVKVSFDFCL